MTGAAASTTSTADRVEWLRTMLRIRLFEERVQELYAQGRIPGTVHLSIGQEAVAVGAVSAMDARDYMTVTHRCHGQALARGVDLDQAFAELMGRASGTCLGLGGSMHLTDYRLGLIGAFAIVGAGLPVAVGAAMSSRLRGDDRVAVAFFGDGAANIGTFHESLNMASIWSAPVVFVVENNMYGEFTPQRETAPSEDVADRASAYRIPAVIVDGQDVDLVHAAVRVAIDRARTGGGPTLVEAKTYRYRGHSRADAARYRPADEVAAWRARDPIDILAARLGAEGAIGPDHLDAARVSIQGLVDETVERVEATPFATEDSLWTATYAGRGSAG